MKITSTLNGVTLASRDEITEHTENSTIHITAAERTEWNAKADASDITWEHVFVAGGSQTATLPAESNLILTNTNGDVCLTISGENGSSFYCPAQITGYQYALSMTPNSLLMAYVNTDDTSKRHGFTVTPEGPGIIGSPLIVPDGTDAAHAINKGQLDDAIAESRSITRKEMEAYIEEYIAGHLPVSPVDLSDYQGPIRLCDENGKEVLAVTQADDGDRHIFIGGKNNIDVQNTLVTISSFFHVGYLDAIQIKSYQYNFPDTQTGGRTDIGISYNVDNKGIDIDSGENFSVVTYSDFSEPQSSYNYLKVSYYQGISMMGTRIKVSSGSLHLYDRVGLDTQADGVLGLKDGDIQYNYQIS